LATLTRHYQVIWLLAPTIVAHLRVTQPYSLVLLEMVGDPGIEPGVGLPGGVTVRCRTLQHVARRRSRLLEGHWAVKSEAMLAES